MKILIPTEGDYIAPSFDTASEVQVIVHYDGQILEEPRSILIDEPSAETLCDMILKERVKTIVCCGIEEEHYQFLCWKKITVFDGIIARWQVALERAINNTLVADEIIYDSLYNCADKESE